MAAVEKEIQEMKAFNEPFKKKKIDELETQIKKIQKYYGPFSCKIQFFAGVGGFFNT